MTSSYLVLLGGKEIGRNDRDKNMVVQNAGRKN